MGLIKYSTSKLLGLSFVILAVVIVIASPKVEAPHPSESSQLSQSLTAEPPPPLPQLPFGGRKLMPSYVFVALYGSPNYPALGALGQQGIDESIARIKELAASYQTLSPNTVIPTFEIIASVASASPTENGDYSQEVDLSVINPWVEAAKQNNIYVILDLQPGRVDFLTQAKHYETLLLQEHVGLALDPEWRLLPNQVHLTQIGHVDANEVNTVADWLNRLIKINNLPQKMFVLHQFRSDMLPNRDLINTSFDNLAFVFHIDGQGSQAAKDETYRNLTTTPPANAYFGWKNFYQKDIGLRTPADTMSVQPTPLLITYQ